MIFPIISFAQRMNVVDAGGGSPIIYSKSTSGFNATDINASNGDASLRFQKAGVTQWNIRNRPADDYLEIFELGGGGSRMVIQDATGNVGIGETTSPSYRLDVLHGGGTGIRNRSSASFSVIDIDGFSGDAALRFQRAGTNQWNIRNRPADDNLEIFELGGGGSRLVLQNSTGNLGVSQDIPKAKIEASGVNSTDNTFTTASSFPATTIIAAKDLNATGAGANKIGIYAGADGGTSQNFGLYAETGTTGTGASFNISLFSKDNINNGTSYAGYFVGRVIVNGTLTTTGPKPFTIDHPLDPENKVLHHFAIESPDVLNMYSGNITTDATGKATVKLPNYFSAINKDFRYQLTVIGTFAQAIISEEIKGNEFVIETNKPNIKVSWEVKAVRNDGYMKYVNTMAVEEEKPAYAKGKYFTPEAFKKPASMGVDFVDTKTIDITKARKTEAVRISEGPSSVDDVPLQKAAPKKVITDKQSTDGN